MVYSGDKVYLESDKIVTAIQFSINNSIDHLFSDEIKDNFNIASYKKGDVVNYLIYSDDNKSIMDYTNILLNYVDKNLRDSQISNLKAASAFGLTLNTIYKDESFFDSSDEIVKIYPNPVKDDLNIIGSIDNDLVIVEVFIYNTLGSIIYKESFKSLDRFKKLNLSHLISGTYIIEIKTLIENKLENKKIYKFIKN